jgi:DNA mismatch repair protein MutS
MSTKAIKDSSETPLMKQYNAIKAKYPDALLLFRVGDFYETFGSDAIKASRILGITLTKRKNGAAGDMELAGFPHHSVDNYMPKLVRAGERVAICDQLEDPKLTKTIVKRGVTELITPGLAMSDQVLEGRKNNFLATLVFGETNHGVAFLDVSTGEFLTAQGSSNYIEKLVQSFNPSEIVYPKSRAKQFLETYGDNVFSFKLEDWVFTKDFAEELLLKHFGTNSLKGFGIEEMNMATIASGAALHYLNDTQHDKVQHITQISRIEQDRYMWMDKFTVRNLELIQSYNENGTSFIDIIDHTLTPMGARMLKRWVVLPLKEQSLINARLEAVSALIKNETLAQNFQQHLKNIGDLERLISKVAVGKVNPKEVVYLRKTLQEILPVKRYLAASKNKSLEVIGDRLNPCEQLIETLLTNLQEEPAISVSKGMVMASGLHQELDQLREIAFRGKDYLEQLQERESERTGIPSLKIAFNNVFGYFLEVRNSHKEKVPQEWIRKQTLVNAERYITPELKEYETKILGAEDRIHAIETAMFQELILGMIEYIAPIQQNAQALAQLDCLLSHATLAIKQNYHLPEVNDTLTLDIKNARHPVIEQRLKPGDSYVPNDIYLNNNSQQIIMITGPNMSGKSAILRQTALVVILAQIGCYVPAENAKIGVVDKLFTRVGASDNISTGESTFMVEMNETASILNNLSQRSLVLLDEIGRGTSTYDGISIAWAIAEYIHQHPSANCKTLFATHYHELNQMTETFSRIKNFNVQVKEIGNQILFMRKLIEGGSEHSFGIHVAKLAGMPVEVLNKANLILADLELKEKSKNLESITLKTSKNGKESKAIKAEQGMQLSFFQLDDPVLSNIRDTLEAIDINMLTPIEAMMKLNEIKKWAGGK